MKWFDLVYAHVVLLYLYYLHMWRTMFFNSQPQDIPKCCAWYGRRVELNTNLLPMCMRFIFFIIRVYCFYYMCICTHVVYNEWLSNVGLWIFCSTPRMVWSFHTRHDALLLLDMLVLVWWLYGALANIKSYCILN